MTQIDLYSAKGTKLKRQLELPEKVFGVEPNPRLLAQYARLYLANQRQGTASAKTRGEVSGGGRKPWRQKGTGRARHGSIRSPIWYKGGVAHGPKPRNWSMVGSESMKKAALRHSLSAKVQGGDLLAWEKWGLEGISTKAWAKLWQQLTGGKKTLVVFGAANREAYLSNRNLAKVEVQTAKDLNAYQVLNADQVVLLEEALPLLEERLGQ